jgi:hypothetical protein
MVLRLDCIGMPCRCCRGGRAASGVPSPYTIGRNRRTPCPVRLYGPDTRKDHVRCVKYRPHRPQYLAGRRKPRKTAHFRPSRSAGRTYGSGRSWFTCGRYRSQYRPREDPAIDHITHDAGGAGGTLRYLLKTYCLLPRLPHRPGLSKASSNDFVADERVLEGPAGLSVYNGLQIALYAHPCQPGRISSRGPGAERSAYPSPNTGVSILRARLPSTRAHLYADVQHTVGDLEEPRSLRPP